MTPERVSLPMSIHALWRRPLALLRPLRRSVWLLLAWSHRHSLALWWRSLRAELTGGRPIDLGRVRRLAVVLARVTADSRISNAPELKLLTLVDDVVVAHSDEHWSKRPILSSVLANVSHVNVVQFA